MKNNPGVLLLLYLFFGGCYSNSGVGSAEENLPVHDTILLSAEDSANVKWMALLNDSLESLGKIYASDAIKVDESGNEWNAAEAIIGYYRANALKVDSIYSIRRILANAEGNISYEIGSFRLKDQQSFRYLVIWKTENGAHPQRTFEFIAPYSPSQSARESIEKRRALWMAYCNAHDVAGLVREVYVNEPLYYNHRPLVKGSEALVQEYQYMTQDSYQLSLEPIIVEQVNSQLIFEIGQGAGSYGGKYILIWQKEPGGSWKILLDANL